MYIYRITFKEKDRESYWDNNPLLIVASDYANAQDKAKNFQPYSGREITSISLMGDTTAKQDVYILRDR